MRTLIILATAALLVVACQKRRDDLPSQTTTTGASTGTDTTDDRPMAPRPEMTSDVPPMTMRDAGPLSSEQRDRNLDGPRP